MHDPPKSIRHPKKKIHNPDPDHPKQELLSTHNSPPAKPLPTSSLFVLQRNFPKLLLFHRPWKQQRNQKKKQLGTILKSFFSSPWSPYNPLIRHHFLGGWGGIILKLTWWSPFQSAKKLLFTFEAALATKKGESISTQLCRFLILDWNMCVSSVFPFSVCVSFMSLNCQPTPRDALGIGL